MPNPPSDRRAGGYLTDHVKDGHHGHSPERRRPQDLRQNLTFRRLTERVHALGPRPTAGVMLAAADGRDLMSVLAVCAEIDERLLDWADGRRWPPAPLARVP
jgi:hypothetical protein